MPNPFRRFFLRHLRKMRFLPSKIYVRIHYEYFSGKKLNLDNPQDFYAKIEWYKVFFRPKILNILVDKYHVRSYVEKKIGSRYLNELYAVYDKVDEIDFNSLPNSFVIKANHTNGHNLIIENKDNLNEKKTLKLLNKWLGKNQYYRRGQEWAYKDVKSKIIIEKFLKEKDRNVLIDYKFYCFDGKVKFLDIHLDRENQHKQCCFDLDFNILPFRIGKQDTVKFFKDFKEPSNFKEMVKLSEILAKNLPFVRVDFYSINGKSVFGELTFYPSDARNKFYPEKYNRIIGDYFKLPAFKSRQKAITEFHAD